jgi:hypothetical protein
MLGPFFRVGMLSISRQATFRRAVVVHLLLVASMVFLVYVQGSFGAVMLGEVLLVAGIVEGAILIGWRLTQMPKSQALEFLLVSPVQPHRVFWAEALVGLGRLALVTLAGLPLLAVLAAPGWLDLLDFAVLTVMPFTWGAITGLGLTVWAYEPLKIRRLGELFVMSAIVVYLIVGVLAGEHFKLWLAWLPPEMSQLILDAFRDFHIYNPFAVMQFWMERGPDLAGERTFWLEVAAMTTVGVLLVRSSFRLKGHFHERHYRPVYDPSGRDRGRIGDRPLSWWAVKRVTEYSGRVNLWLAGGFGILYAAYTVAGSAWPEWLGRVVFQIVENAGGIPAIATGLVVLAAVPAAFQYGLWDSNAQDRCRRLELLLLTGLEPRDYWQAAAAAAWRRGRGYFIVAVILWLAAASAGQMNAGQVAGALAAGVLLWSLYFTLGFRAFSNGMQANGLGSLLTLGLPLVAAGLGRSAWPALAALVPPGNVYQISAGKPSLAWAAGALLAGLGAVLLGRHALAHCDRDLRRWYELHHGKLE